MKNWRKFVDQLPEKITAHDRDRLSRAFGRLEAKVAELQEAVVTKHAQGAGFWGRAASYWLGEKRRLETERDALLPLCDDLGEPFLTYSELAVELAEAKAENKKLREAHKSDFRPLHSRWEAGIDDVD